jgi:hypothetical protein
VGDYSSNLPRDTGNCEHVISPYGPNLYEKNKAFPPRYNLDCRASPPFHPLNGARVLRSNKAAAAGSSDGSRIRRQAVGNSIEIGNSIPKCTSARHSSEEDEHVNSFSKIVVMIDSMIIFRPVPSLQCPVTKRVMRRRGRVCAR